MSLLDSLDSTLDNDKKLHAVQRTSGDMHTIPELTGERATATRGNSEDHSTTQDVTVDSNRRLSSMQQTGYTLGNDNDSTNQSAKHTADKSVSGSFRCVSAAVLSLCCIWFWSVVTFVQFC